MLIAPKRRQLDNLRHLRQLAEQADDERDGTGAQRFMRSQYERALEEFQTGSVELVSQLLEELSSQRTLLRDWLVGRPIYDQDFGLTICSYCDAELGYAQLNPARHEPHCPVRRTLERFEEE